MANNAKGKASAAPNPAKPIVTGHGPCVKEPTNKEPRITPVHEKETITSVKAIKKIPPILVIFAFASALLANPPGRVISKYPKKEMAKRIKMAKKNTFSGALVEILFNISGCTPNK